jgi:hypothetical protein
MDGNGRSRRLLPPRARWRIAVGALAVVGFLGRSTASEPGIDLEALLDRLGRVAELYRDGALHFTCDESIQFSSASTTSLHRFRYVYRYSESQGALVDHREPVSAPRGSSLASGASPALEGLGLPAVLLRPYSWIFLFTPELRKRHRFEIEGTERILRRPAVRLSFRALPPYERGVTEWVGTAWVDRETAQLLRVEAYRVTDGGSRVERYTTDFDLSRNGMRFPGQVRIWNELGRFAVVQTYKRYRFYNVRTEAEIRERTR